MTIPPKDRLHSCPVPRDREPTLYEELCEAAAAMHAVGRAFADVFITPFRTMKEHDHWIDALRYGYEGPPRTRLQRICDAVRDFFYLEGEIGVAWLAGITVGLFLGLLMSIFIA